MDTKAATILEDRSFGGDKPYIDLTPENVWGNPIIGQVGKTAWASIVKFVEYRSDGACELCGSSPTTSGVMGRRANKFRVELRFSHDEASRIATLRRLLHVCVPCSQSIHLCQTELVSSGMPLGRSPLVGAIARLVKFHNLTEVQVRQWLKNELEVWSRRHSTGYPLKRNVGIIEDGTSRLWR